MAIVTWDPSRDVSLLQGDMNRMFERFFGASAGDGAQVRRWMPAMDLVEEGDEYVLRADLPGLRDEDVSIELHDRTLTISGERTMTRKPAHDGGYARYERSYGRFERTLTLPDGVDADAIEAEFHDGVLELHIPKPVEEQPRRISIRTRTNSTGDDAARDGASDAHKTLSHH